ncbi:hypothetical protein GCM10012275_29800 [Longimycelium tulufanense]|uniref:Esterase n=2 Tax=Longimycelium tulufanense TaxID=907463 RepID=A0A8J3CEZ0_9PSEU|nr:hypothetical protein GCM10012275_29800 [Longimycelium tulufanense]
MRCAPPSSTEVVAESWLDDRVLELKLRSASLQRVVTVALLTPRDWNARGNRRWPTLYFLHGADDGPDCWIHKTDLPARAAELDALVVLPEAGPMGFYSDWLGPDSHGVVPRWESFHLGELPAVLAQRYAAGGPRAVAGVSMGGHGAIRYAARHPGLFTVAVSYSGLLHTTRAGMSALIGWLMVRQRERPFALWGSPWRSRQRWRAHDPYHLASALRGTRVLLTAGTGRPAPGDPRVRGSGLMEAVVAASTADLAGRLAALGMPAQLLRVPGTHDWPTWQRALERSWPFVADALKVA